jgi:hypothetical protein
MREVLRSVVSDSSIRRCRLILFCVFRRVGSRFCATRQSLGRLYLVRRKTDRSQGDSTWLCESILVKLQP